MSAPETLWSSSAGPDRRMMAYTVGDDRSADTRLLSWDVIGSLGHVEALASGGIISRHSRGQMRRALLAALEAARAGALRIEARHEDVHSAVEFWLTRHAGAVGQRIHTGRSRNDQVALDIRLYLKNEVLALHARMTALAVALLAFGRRHRKVVWPGYTHHRIAMPSSAGLWAAGYAEGLIDAADGIAGFWGQLDRSPLGTAAGYGVPLPLDREAAARSLGFAGIDQVVTTTQNARGQLEGAVLFWCLGAAQECAKFSADVIQFSATESGWLVLPNRWATGSSIMPHKRNPDLFELTRARAAAIEGDLATVLALRSKLAGGYHRDFQLLKAPLWRGVDSTREMLTVLEAVVPELDVDAARGASALVNDVFATDDVMRRVRQGTPFRQAYHEVAAASARGDAFPRLSPRELAATRDSTGAMGNIPWQKLAARARAAQRWAATAQRQYQRALDRLTGRGRR